MGKTSFTHSGKPVLRDRIKRSTILSTANLNILLDAGSIGSWNGCDYTDSTGLPIGSGGGARAWRHLGRDMSDTGAGFYKTQNSFPQFFGSVGGMSVNDYFKFNVPVTGGANQCFTYLGDNNDSWMDALHTAGAAWTCLTWVYPCNTAGLGTAQSIFGTNGGSNTTGNGVFFTFNGTANLTAAVVNTNVTVGQFNSTLQATDNTWQMVGVSVNSAAGATGGYFYKDTSITTFNATYTAPATGATSQVIQIGARGAGNLPMREGTRLAIVAVWNRALTNTEVQEFYDITKDRFKPLSTQNLNANLVLYLDAAVPGSYHGSPTGVPPTIEFTDLLTDATDLTTYNFTANIGSPTDDRLVVVGASGPNLAARTLTSINIASQAATLAGTSASSNNAMSWGRSIVNTGTTATVNVTFSGAMNKCLVHVFTIKNYVNSTPGANSGITAASAALGTVDIDVAANGQTLYMCSMANNNTLTADLSVELSNTVLEGAITKVFTVVSRGSATAYNEGFNFGNATAGKTGSGITYGPSNQHHFDISGNGNTFVLGANTSDTTTDPTFTTSGTRPYKYWLFDGGDYFTYLGSANNTHNPIFIQKFHKVNANGTCAFWVNFANNSNAQSIYATLGNTISIGSRLHIDVTGNVCFRLANGSALVDLTSNLVVSTNTWCLVGVSLNDSVNGSMFFLNSNTFTNSTAFSSPSSSDATWRMKIGARSDTLITEAGTPLKSGAKMGEFVFWDRTLSAAEINTFFQATRSKYGV